MNERTGLLYALAAALLFGVSGAVAADTFQSLDPLRVAQLRSVLAALALGAVAYRRRRTAHGGKLLHLAFFGSLLAAVTITYYWAIDRLGVGPGVTLQFIGPVFVLAWMRLVQRRRVGGAAWAAAAIAVSGIALVTQAWDLKELDLLGILAGLGAAVSLAAYLLVGEHLGRSMTALAMTAYGFAFSSVILLLAVPFEIPDVGGVVWGQIVWIALAGTAIPFLLEIAAVKRADPGRVGVGATSEPVIATATAWIALGQALSLVQIVGAALVIAGVATVQAMTHSVAPEVPPSVV